MAAPRIIGYRPGVPDQPGGFLDLCAVNPADRFEGRWGVAPAQSGVKFENRMADHLATERGDTVFAFERKPRIAAVIAAGRFVVRNEACRRTIPGKRSEERRVGKECRSR